MSEEMFEQMSEQMSGGVSQAEIPTDEEVSLEKHEKMVREAIWAATAIVWKKKNRIYNTAIRKTHKNEKKNQSLVDKIMFTNNDYKIIMSAVELIEKNQSIPSFFRILQEVIEAKEEYCKLLDIVMGLTIGFDNSKFDKAHEAVNKYFYWLRDCLDFQEEKERYRELFKEIKEGNTATYNAVLSDFTEKLNDQYSLLIEMFLSTEKITHENITRWSR